MKIYLIRSIKALTFLALLLILFIAIIPAFISTEWGKTQMLDAIHPFLPGRLEIKTVQLQWGKGQVLREIHYYASEKAYAFTIDEIATEASFWPLVSGSIDLGSLKIKGFRIETNEKEEKWIEVDNASKRKTKEEKKVIFLPTTIEADADFMFLGEGKTIRFEIRGKTKQNNLMGEFQIKSNINTTDSLDWSALFAKIKDIPFNREFQDMDFHLEATHFPVQFLDRMLLIDKPHMKIVFSSLIGDYLDLMIHFQDSAESALEAVIRSPLLQGELSAKTDHSSLLIKEGSTFKCLFSPHFINLFTPKRTKVLNSIPLNIEVTSFSIPLKDFKENPVDLANCEFLMKCEIPVKTDIQTNHVGTLNINSMKVILFAQENNPLINLKANGFVGYYGNESEINYQNWIPKE